METLIAPGMVDAHVHLREPGATHKEDIWTGTAAALAGGVVAVLDMPNNTPPIVDENTWGQKAEAFRAKAVADYGLFLGYAGGDLAPFRRLAPKAVGLKLYLDETFGDLLLARDRLMDVFAAWPGPGPIAIHGESESIRVALEAAAETGRRLHVCHVPSPNDLLRIAAAREKGVEVSCEVTPHHLFLSALDVERLGAFGRMKPPLLKPDEVRRFWELLDLVDIIASDHAPHTRAEKEGPNPPPGVPGLETTLPLLFWAVEQKRLTWERLWELVFSRPLEIYGLKPPVEAHIEVEWRGPYRLGACGYRTKCGWSPFAGQMAYGFIRCVTLHGRAVFAEGRLLAMPGEGRPLERLANR